MHWHVLRNSHAGIFELVLPWAGSSELIGEFTVFLLIALKKKPAIVADAQR